MQILTSIIENLGHLATDNSNTDQSGASLSEPILTMVQKRHAVTYRTMPPARDANLHQNFYWSGLPSMRQRALLAYLRALPPALPPTPAAQGETAAGRENAFQEAVCQGEAPTVDYASVSFALATHNGRRARSTHAATA